MRHPKSGPIVEVTQESFDTLWQDKGWVEVDDDEARAELSKLANADLVVDDNADQAADANTGPGEALTGEQLTAVAGFDITTAVYTDTLKGTLAAVADSRGIDSTGTKAELWERLGGSVPAGS